MKWNKISHGTQTIFWRNSSIHLPIKTSYGCANWIICQKRISNKDERKVFRQIYIVRYEMRFKIISCRDVWKIKSLCRRLEVGNLVLLIHFQSTYRYTGWCTNQMQINSDRLSQTGSPMNILQFLPLSMAIEINWSAKLWAPSHGCWNIYWFVLYVVGYLYNVDIARCTMRLHLFVAEISNFVFGMKEVEHWENLTRGACRTGYFILS